jgi:feruloyl esterase
MLWKTPPKAMPMPQYMDYFLAYNIDDTEPSIHLTNDVFKQSVASWGVASSPDLSAFRQSGGKMISWIGNADPAVGPNATIEWFNGVNDRENGRAGDFLKLFVVPGMNHCGGGPATDKFDMLTALENWVERGKAPDSVPAEASNPGYFGVASRSRPLCPYPSWAHYKGGDINLASSFVCQP